MVNIRTESMMKKCKRACARAKNFLSEKINQSGKTEDKIIDPRPINVLQTNISPASISESVEKTRKLLLEKTETKNAERKEIEKLVQNAKCENYEDVEFIYTRSHKDRVIVDKKPGSDDVVKNEKVNVVVAGKKEKNNGDITMKKETNKQIETEGKTDATIDKKQNEIESVEKDAFEIEEDGLKCKNDTENNFKLLAAAKHTTGNTQENYNDKIINSVTADENLNPIEVENKIANSQTESKTPGSQFSGENSLEETFSRLEISPENGLERDMNNLSLDDSKKKKKIVFLQRGPIRGKEHLYYHHPYPEQRIINQLMHSGGQVKIREETVPRENVESIEVADCMRELCESLPESTIDFLLNEVSSTSVQNQSKPSQDIQTGNLYPQNITESVYSYQDEAQNIQDGCPNQYGGHIQNGFSVNAVNNEYEMGIQNVNTQNIQNAFINESGGNLESRALYGNSPFETTVQNPQSQNGRSNQNEVNLENVSPMIVYGSPYESPVHNFNSPNGFNSESGCSFENGKSYNHNSPYQPSFQNSNSPNIQQNVRQNQDGGNFENGSTMYSPYPVKNANSPIGLSNQNGGHFENDMGIYNHKQYFSPIQSINSRNGRSILNGVNLKMASELENGVSIYPDESPYNSANSQNGSPLQNGVKIIGKTPSNMLLTPPKSNETHVPSPSYTKVYAVLPSDEEPLSKEPEVKERKKKTLHMSYFRRRMQALEQEFKSLPCCTEEMGGVKLLRSHLDKCSPNTLKTIVKKLYEMKYLDLFSLLYDHVLPGLKDASADDDINTAILLLSGRRLLTERADLLLLEDYGLALLSRACAACYRRPRVPAYLAHCVREAAKLDRTADREQPVFTQTDSRGASLVGALSRHGDSRAACVAILSANRPGERPLFAVNATDSDGYTPLHTAVRAHEPARPSLHTIHALLAHGNALIDAKDKKAGDTALHLAVDSSNSELDLVLSVATHAHARRALAHAHNNAQRTPIDLARAASKMRPSYPEDILLFLKKCRN